MRKYQTLFLLFAVFATSSMAAEPTLFAWSRISVDAEPVLKLGRLKTSREIVDAIRKDPVLNTKVIVLNYKSDALAKDRVAEDLGENVDEAQKRAAIFYTEHRLAILDTNEAGEFGGVFIAKYTTLPKLPSRPLLDENILLLIGNSPREVILHEAVHALIESQRRVEPRLVNGVKTHIRQATRAKYLELSNEIKKTEKSLPDTLSKLSLDDKEKALARHYSNLVAQLDTLLQVMADSQGEELDVTRFLEERKIELNIPRAELYENFSYAISNFNPLDQTIETLREQTSILEKSFTQTLPKASTAQLTALAKEINSRAQTLENDRKLLTKMLGIYPEAK